MHNTPHTFSPASLIDAPAEAREQAMEWYLKMKCVIYIRRETKMSKSTGMRWRYRQRDSYIYIYIYIYTNIYIFIHTYIHTYNICTYIEISVSYANFSKDKVEDESGARQQVCKNSRNQSGRELRQSTAESCLYLSIIYIHLSINLWIYHLYLSIYIYIYTKLFTCLSIPFPLSG